MSGKDSTGWCRSQTTVVPYKQLLPHARLQTRKPLAGIGFGHVGNTRGLGKAACFLAQDHQTDGHQIKPRQIQLRAVKDLMHRCVGHDRKDSNIN